jgi:hypothetical protein
MKCNSCGAISGPNKLKCEFCGADQRSPTTGNGITSSLSAAGAPQVTFVKDTLNLVGELNGTTSSGFNIWAFLFPVAYLFGYDSNDNGKKVAATTLIPALVLSIVMYLSFQLANALNVLIFIWVIFVSYLVATRTHALVVKTTKFNLGKAILAQVLFSILYVVILSL